MVDTVPMAGTATMTRMALMLTVSIWRTNTFLQVRTPSDLVGCCLTQSPGSRPRKVDLIKEYIWYEIYNLYDRSGWHPRRNKLGLGWDFDDDSVGDYCGDQTTMTCSCSCVSSGEFKRLRGHVKTLSCMRRIRVVWCDREKNKMSSASYEWFLLLCITVAVYLGTFQKQKSLSAAVLRTKHKEKETCETVTIHIEGYWL